MEGTTMEGTTVVFIFKIMATSTSWFLYYCCHFTVFIMRCSLDILAASKDQVPTHARPYFSIAFLTSLALSIKVDFYHFCFD